MKVRGNLDIYGPYVKIAHFRDEKASTTVGGSLTAAAWNTRTLNTTVNNEISGVVLSSNQITLPAGKYFVDARCPGFGINEHRARIQDVTNSVTLIVGGNAESGSGDVTNTDATVKGVINLVSSITIELQHHKGGGNAGTNAGGNDSSISGVNEVYSEIIIWKI